jgi:UDP-glucose 4-epimerase
VTRDADYRRVLVTGAGGYVGRQLVEALAADPRGVATLVATDVRLPPDGERAARVRWERLDVRDGAACRELLVRHAPDLVVHLAAIVTPGRDSNRRLEWEVDVQGTRHVLEACVAAGVRKLVYTSSGAAYGYHADNPEWLDESHPLRGNAEFAYSDHKRQVEEMLAGWRTKHPELLQLVFRPGTILGARARNQITDLFEGRFVLGVGGAQSPFVFVWDADVVGAILRGIHHGGVGAFNLAGDGTLTMREIARRLGKPYVEVPPWLLRGALWLLQKLGLTQYGPEQIGFLQYRPVLSNRRLVQEFGYVPQKTTRETFEAFIAARSAA